MATIYIDDKPYEVKDGQNLLQACLSLGFNIPYFCWHPALQSVGACRQCAVKQFRDEKDTRGRIVMSCMTPATEGTRISIDDQEAREFRAGIIELLMTNHPHDCPVCDEGGECHLQDMTVMTGHNYREYRFSKRTHHNQFLGPFINHEMNRCIQCYRCVRFYRDYAGGHDLDVFASHNHVYFGRHEEGTLESEFSGNLVEVCPTGVFTDKTLKQHYTRKWDLQTAPSVCVHCGLGCNTIAGERYGSLRRIQNRFNSEVNGYFLCDRGRFGYEFVNSEKRILAPRLRNSPGTDAAPATKDSVMNHMEKVLRFGARVIGIGSPRASVEANFALRRLVGPENFYSGMSVNDCRLVALIIDIMKKGPSRPVSLDEIRKADAVLVLGEDLTNYAPLAALAVRCSVRVKPMKKAKGLRIPEWQSDSVRVAVQEERGPLFIATPYHTKLDDVATSTYHAAPDDIARLGFAIAHEIDPLSPPVEDLPDDLRSMAVSLAEVLKSAKRPIIISGGGSGSAAVIRSAANVSYSLLNNGVDAGLFFTTPETNSLGLGLMVCSDINEAFRAAEGADAVIVLENDLYRRADKASVDRIFESAKEVIVIDSIESITTKRSGVVLPAGTFAESTGTFVNNEGRAQRFFKIFVPESEVMDSWRWLRDMLIASGRGENAEWGSSDDILAALVEELPLFKPAQAAAPDADFRIAGQKIPRQSRRYSGRTSMLADISVHEPKPPDDPDSALAFSMEGCAGRPPAPLIPRYWVPGWNSVQSLNKYQKEVGGPLSDGDPGVRLIVPALSGTDRVYYTDVPAAFSPVKKGLLVVPVYHIFGSEELSIISPALAERVPKPYLALGPADAARLGVNEGEVLELSIGKNVYGLKVILMDSLPDGVAGLPAGLSGLQGIILPAVGSVRK